MKCFLAISLLLVTNQIFVKADEIEEDEYEHWLDQVTSPRRRLFDIATVAAWTGVLSAVGAWGGANYGGQIHIENHLCHDLIYNGNYVLTHGSWKSHCNNVLGGTADGCTVTGNWNQGAEGMMQFEVENTGWALS